MSVAGRPLRQVFNLFMPRVNIRRQSAWYKDSEPQNFSPTDSQVSPASAFTTLSLHTIPIYCQTTPTSICACHI